MATCGMQNEGGALCPVTQTPGHGRFLVALEQRGNQDEKATLQVLKKTHRPSSAADSPAR
jgi:hypothetical protein